MTRSEKYLEDVITDFYPGSLLQKMKRTIIIIKRQLPHLTGSGTKSQDFFFQGVKV